MDNTFIEFIENIDNIKKTFKAYKEDPESIANMDNLKWEFLKGQLMAQCKGLSKEAREEYLNKNVNMEDVFLPERLTEITMEKLHDIIENNEENENKMATVKITLDEDFNRHLDIKLMDPSNLSNLILPPGLIEGSDDLPPFNEYIKSQIEEMCKTILDGSLSESKIYDIIKAMTNEYKIKPYPVEYLEGYINGYLDSKGED